MQTLIEIAKISAKPRHLAGLSRVCAVALSCCGAGSVMAQEPSPATAATAQDAIGSDTPQETGQIISDDEFESYIPPLGDPDAPLETIEEWERTQEEKQSDAENADDVIPAIPALADGDDEEALADPIITDPVLAEPLPSVENFDAEPPPTPTEVADTKTEIRYDYRIAGLDGDDIPEDRKEILGDIRTQFEDMSLLEDGDNKAANGAMVTARLREDRKLLQSLLEAQGFYDAVIKGSLVTPEQEGSPLLADIIVAPGQRYVLGKIAFDTGSVDIRPDDLIRESFPPKSGAPIVAARILAAEARIAVQLPQSGYPFVKIGQRDILLDPDTMEGDYTLPVDTGPRSYFGKVIVSGDDQVFDAGHIGVLQRFDRGELYDAAKLDDLREALVSTSLFSTVAVEPVLSDDTAEDGTAYADLLVRQVAGPARTISGSAGYETGQGFRVEGSWTHRNLFPPEGALIAGAVAGTREQGANLTFRRSNAGRRDRTVQARLSALRSDFDAYRAETIQLSGRISRESTPIWQKRWTYGYGFELIGSRERDFDIESDNRDRDNYLIFALPGQIGYDRSNSLLDPTRGFKVNLRASPEASLGRGTQIYGRAKLDASVYQKVSDGIVLAARGAIGSIIGADRTAIAPSRRYYAGGGGSVRGFGFQELGPKDPNTDPIGGRSVVEAAVEGRYRFGDYGVVAFVDAGQVYTSSTPGFDNLRFGVGVGGRFYTNFGPIRLDVATPINRQPGEGWVAVYVSIGQAF